jgi:hypothetical protein
MGEGIVTSLAAHVRKLASKPARIHAFLFPTISHAALRPRLAAMETASTPIRTRQIAALAAMAVPADRFAIMASAVAHPD